MDNVQKHPQLVRASNTDTIFIAGAGAITGAGLGGWAGAIIGAIIGFWAGRGSQKAEIKRLQEQIISIEIPAADTKTETISIEVPAKDAARILQTMNRKHGNGEHGV